MSRQSQSQADRLLARLQASPGQWVPMPELARACSPSGSGVGICVSRRIYDLRQRDHVIDCCTESRAGRKLTFYRLLQFGGPRPSTLDQTSAPGAPGDTPANFKSQIPNPQEATT